MKMAIASKVGPKRTPEAESKEQEAMKVNKERRFKKVGVLTAVFCALYFLVSVGPALAQFTHPDSNPQTNWDVRKTYFLRFPAAAQHGPRVDDNPEGHDVIEDKRSQGPGEVEHHTSGPVFSWPVVIPEATSAVPTLRDEAIQMNLFQTFGYPVSDTQFQVIERYNQNRFLEQLYDPEKLMWLGTSIGSIQANSAGNSTANMAVNQNITAIEYCSHPIINFTIDDGNVWNRLRNELFIPMAVLLLLPGAVLAQVRAIVAQGSPAIVGEVNPFEGIIRSIVAIFLIPGSYLVINYGIDVANSIRHTISSEFQRIFGEDMYELAKCSIKRAFPINDPRSNRNAIEHSEEPHIENHDYIAPYESLSMGLRLFDPCLGVDESRVPDEDVRQVKPVNRLLVNSVGAGEGLTWNIMCAFQVVFLYYLWCMGPIAAALSVWPIGKLRDAFKNWCEGVLVVCFWTLFWHTIILLLAAFKGVGDTGTIFVACLLAMAVQAVKSAFDFVGLVSQGGAMASNIAKQSGGGGGGSAGGGQSAGSRGAAGAAAAIPGGDGGGRADSATRTPGGAAMDGAAVSSGGLAASMGVSGGGGGAGSPSPSAASISASAQMAGALTDSGPSGSGGASGSQITADAGVPGMPGSGMDGASTGADAAGKLAHDPGVPPIEGDRAGTGSGDRGLGGVEAALGAVGLAGAAGAIGDKAGGPPMSSDMSLNYSASINKLAQGGDLQNLADLSMNKDLSTMTPAALVDAMNNPAQAIGRVTDGIMGEAAGGQGIREQLNKFDQAVLGGAAGGILDATSNATGVDARGVADRMLSGDMSMAELRQTGVDALDNLGRNALPVDAGPLTGELGLNRFMPSDAGALTGELGLNRFATDPGQGPVSGMGSDLAREALAPGAVAAFGQKDILPNGIDADFAHNPQAGLARSAAQDLMNIDADPNKAGVQPLVSQDMLRDALNGDQNAIAAIDKNLGTSPEVLRAALNGDSGSASLLLAASGHRAMDDPGSPLHRAAAEGNFAAIEALKVAPMTHEGTIMAAAHGNPVAAAQALHNSADTQSWMASRDMTIGELQGGGIAQERFREAMGGDVTAQQEISRTMGLGDNNFDVVRGAVGGDRQDAATVLAARGAEEMRHMSPEQIHQAVQSGDTSILAARATSPEVLSRAISGDMDARQSIQEGLASDPNLLYTANTGQSFESYRAINAMTGERPDVVAAASSNAQNIMGMFAEPGQVREAMSGGFEQRQAFIDQVANQMQVSPHVLRDAVGGDSTASATLLAVAGHHGHVANLAREGDPLARAAMATQQTVDIDTLRAASTGNESAQFAVQNAVAQNPELVSMARAGSPEAVSALSATQSFTDGGGMAIGHESQPFGTVYAASREAQATLQDLGVDPTAYARGDVGAQNQVYQALGIEPGSRVAQSMHGTIDRALHGDGGASATFMAAAGRTEAVQELARQGDFSAQASVVAAHSVPGGILQSAVEGSAGAQAYVQNELASSPHMMALASQGNEQAMYSVQSAHGSDAIANISASANTQNLMGYFADNNTVQTALYGHGAERATAMTGIADRIGVSPQVLDSAIHGSAAMASVAFVQASRSEPIQRAAESGDVLARSIQSTAAGQNFSVVSMAATGHPQAAEAVGYSLRESQLLQNLSAQGHPEAAAVRAVSSVQQDPNAVAPSQEALSRNIVTPTAEQQVRLEQAAYLSPGSNVSFAGAETVSSASSGWGDYTGGSTSMSSSYSYSADAYRGAGEASYVAYHPQGGSQVFVDAGASSFVPSNAGLQPQVGGDVQFSGSTGGYENYQVTGGNQYQVEPQPQHQPQLQPGAEVQYRGGTPENYQVAGGGHQQIEPQPQPQPQLQPGAEVQYRGGTPENYQVTGGGHQQVDTQGMSTGGASPYERIADAAPESPRVHGGFSDYQASHSPPDSGAPGTYIANADAGAVRSDPDPGTIARGQGSPDSYGRSSVEDRPTDVVAYNQPSSSFGRALKDALPGAGMMASRPQNQGQDLQRQGQEKADVNTQGVEQRRTQSEAEAKRRHAEEERVQQQDAQAREAKKAEYKRYQDKIKAEMDEIEAEAERLRKEEEGE
ncbi:hypothetical protein GC174_04460 [bacterium]|nr:hypothetical protein [bacterium]